MICYLRWYHIINDDETLSNLIEKIKPTHAKKKGGKNKKRGPMSDRNNTQKWKHTNKSHKRKQLRHIKRGQNNNLGFKTLVNHMKHIWKGDGRET